MQVAEFNNLSYGFNNLLLSVLIIHILSVKVMWVTGQIGYLSKNLETNKYKSQPKVISG